MTGGAGMGRKILCEACGSVLNEDILKQNNSLNTCLVCGASLGMDEDESAPKEELVDWYYYKFKNGSGYLSTVYAEDDEDVKLAYKFKAPPEDENGDCEAAKEILRREYDPTAFATPSVNTKPEPVVRCPRCRSTAVQLVPKKWSPLTGFRTNSVMRVCVNCKHKF